MFRDIDKAFHWIESFTNLEKNAKARKRHYRPERMNEILNYFGNPHLNSAKIIHVAGSKGKGSTSALIAAALRENGFKTGLYTSPHVQHYRERIQVNSSPLSDSCYLESINRIERELQSELPGDTEPTTFELLTLLAFLLFESEQCDYAVIETGLGGRLDATNAVKPVASVLTPIELEHTQWLGDSIELIAAEKAGIIKENIPVFSSKQKIEAEKIFRETAESRHSHIRFINESVQSITSELDPKGSSYRIHLKDNTLTEGKLSLIGNVQSWNAALALDVLTNLLPEVDKIVWIEGMAKATLPGRMEIISHSPLIVLDGSHTRQSVSMALESFNKLKKSSECTLLFACQDDKDASAMAEVLAPSFTKGIITTPGFFKESHPEKVYSVFSRLIEDCHLEEIPQKALELILSDERDTLVIGSFMLAGAVKDYLGEKHD